MEEEEERERRILNDKRAKERLAYEKTRSILLCLKGKIAAMKKRNAQEAALDKKIKFLDCNDFQKWTNSFARKSVLWDPKKQKLMGTNAIVDEIIDGEQTKTNPHKEKCCGQSAKLYGHQLKSPFNDPESSIRNYDEIVDRIKQLERVVTNPRNIYKPGTSADPVQEVAKYLKFSYDDWFKK